MAGFHFHSYEGAILTDGFNCDGFIMEHNSHRLPNQKFHPDLERGKGLRCGRCNRWMLLGIKEIGWPEEGEGKAVSAEIASDTNPAPATPA